MKNNNNVYSKLYTRQLLDNICYHNFLKKKLKICIVGLICRIAML